MHALFLFIIYCFSDIVEGLNLTYTLHIKDETHNKVLSLKFGGTKSILDIKSAVYCITNIPVRYQEWSGWPESIKEDTTLLGYSGVDHPVHFLFLKSSEIDEKKKHKRVIKNLLFFIPLICCFQID